MIFCAILTIVLFFYCLLPAFKNNSEQFFINTDIQKDFNAQKLKDLKLDFDLNKIDEIDFETISKNLKKS